MRNHIIVIVWTSYFQDSSAWGIYGQQFTTAGNKVGSEFKCNSYSLNEQYKPAVSFLFNGGFVVVW